MYAVIIQLMHRNMNAVAILLQLRTKSFNTHPYS
jgi:hypothetical protein